MEKFIDCNTQAVTELFDCGDRSAVISSAYNVVYSRLRNAANTAEFVNGYISFLTQLNNALTNSFTYSHWYHLFFYR